MLPTNDRPGGFVEDVRGLFLGKPREASELSEFATLHSRPRFSGGSLGIPRITTPHRKADRLILKPNGPPVNPEDMI